jgi:flagellar hook-length control protein FliK
MNNTPIDYVLSAPLPRSEAATGPLRPRDDAPRFESHFRQENETRDPTSPAPPRSYSQSQSQSSSVRSPQREQATDDRPAKPTDDGVQSTDESSEEKDKASDAQPTPVAAAVPVPVKQDVADEAAALVDASQELRVKADGTEKPATKEVPRTSALNKPVSLEPLADAQPEKASAKVVDGSISPDAEVPIDTTEKKAIVQADDESAAPSADPLLAAITDDAANNGTAIEASAAEAAPNSEPGSESRVKTKSNKHTGDHSPLSSNDAGGAARNDDRTQAPVAAPDQAVETAAAITSDHPETSVAGKSAAEQPDEKRIATKLTPATNDELSPGPPAVAAGSRAAAPSPTPPVVANVDQAQPIAGRSPAVAEPDLKTQPVKPVANEGLLSPFARLERGGPLSAQANRASSNRAAGPNVDPARFVSRVARAVHTAHERGAPLQLRLSPPELGTMRLELAVRGGVLTASIETDNSNARQVLLDNLPALRDRLAEQSIRIERFDVDVRRDGTGDGGGRPNAGPEQQGHDHHRESAPHRTNAGRGNTSQTTSDAPPPVRRTITNTSINVIA